VDNFANVYVLDAFKRINGAGQDGSAIVRLKDIARVEVGRKQYISENRLNGMPEGIECLIALDTTDFVRLSIKELLHSFLGRFCWSS